jgi:hypothetical protein
VRTNAQTYVIKEGETLFEVAIKFYEDRDMWVEVAEENGIRDPRHVTAGQEIKLPDAGD